MNNTFFAKIDPITNNIKLVNKAFKNGAIHSGQYYSRRAILLSAGLQAVVDSCSYPAIIGKPNALNEFTISNYLGTTNKKSFGTELSALLNKVKTRTGYYEFLDATTEQSGFVKIAHQEVEKLLDIIVLEMSVETV